MATEFLASEGEHWYKSKTLDIYYPSATTILAKYPKGKQFEKYLAELSSAEEGREKLEAAGKRGTRVHEGSEILELGGTLRREDYQLDEWNLLIGFIKWHRDYRPVKVAVEQSLVSDIIKTGGTIDRVYLIDGVLTILDIKTSGAVYESYWCQTACYAKLWNEFSGEMPVQTAILRLSNKLKKNGYQYVTHNSEEIERDFEVFKSVQNIWEYENEGSQPKLVEVPDTLTLYEELHDKEIDTERSPKVRNTKRQLKRKD